MNTLLTDQFRDHARTYLRHIESGGSPDTHDSPAGILEEIVGTVPDPQATRTLTPHVTEVARQLADWIDTADTHTQLRDLAWDIADGLREEIDTSVMFDEPSEYDRFAYTIEMEYDRAPHHALLRQAIDEYMGDKKLDLERHALAALYGYREDWADALVRGALDAVGTALSVRLQQHAT